MGTVFETIESPLAEWIGDQKLFFVATSPLAADGLINCSPKGLETFRILTPTSVAYADFNGSGIETAAHLRENGRIQIMLCAFHGPPRIVRLSGNGRYLTPDTDGFKEINTQFGIDGLRGIVQVELKRIADSCGYGVPKFDYVGERSSLEKWCNSQSPEQILEYQQAKNRTSIDGLPGLDV